MTTETTDAPGLRPRRRKGETAWYWVATSVTRRAADYPIKTIRLNEASEEERAARCRLLTAELREWLAGRDTSAFDGTIRSLVRAYRNVPESPYADVKENTRDDYNQRLRLIETAVGGRHVAVLTAVDFRRWHREFRAPAHDGSEPRIRQAHGLMTMVRMILGFGVSMRMKGCASALGVISQMEFESPKRRKQALAFEQAEKIIDLALAKGRRSIALGQALQFELTMRQVDVIGKWEKADGESGIVYNGNRWGGGLLWSHISAAMTIAKETTKTGAEGQWDLTEHPLVMKALAAYPPEDRIGPMVVSELTGLPYDRHDYAHEWRPFADAADVPRDVWNRDSRAGGITEGWDADATEKDLQRTATHTDPAMTRRYARNSLASSSRVARLRVEYRKRAENGDS